VQAALAQLLAGRTGIIVAHRLETLAFAADILVLDEGRVLEHGPRLALEAEPTSCFSELLRIAADEVLA
jgi:ABC-type transport system involved in Fe-S cluster assembly fused permease/ATPase subunit